MRIHSVTFLAILLSVTVSISCAQKKVNKDDVESPKAVEVSAKTTAKIAGCNPELWKRVYNPKRLEVIKDCITVTGVIEESNVESDGDQHMLLKLDAGQDEFLNKRNIKKKTGDLVIEAVCVNKVKDRKVGKTCKGYVNEVEIPDIGTHVSVTGSYVIDSHNGWAEIHPISKIEVIK